LGIILFNTAAYSCQSFEVDPLGVGYWSFEDFDGDCAAYSDEFDPDGPFKFGRAIGIIGSILGYTLIIMLLVASCVRYPLGRKIFFVMGGCMILMSIFALLLFVGLSSDHFDIGTLELEVGAAGWCIIPSFFFWVAAAFATALTMKARDDGGAPTSTPPAAMHAGTEQKAAPIPEVQDVTE